MSIAVRYATLDEALAACIQGWNLRCNVCGYFGASWIDEGEIRRPGWGAIALCELCLTQARAEVRRHREAMARLTRIEFQQVRRAA